MAKTDPSKGRGAMLVEDEPDLLRPAFSSRSRVEKEFLPDGFAERYPTKRGDIANDVRVRRRVPVRKGTLPLWMKTRWGRIVVLAVTVIAITAGVAAAMAVRHFFDHDPRFRIETSDFIQTVGNSQLTRDDLLSVFGSDIGRNIFYIPLAERRAQLEQIPWVEHATVMRLLPNQLRVAVKERTPVAFVRVGEQIKLVDGAGVILDMLPTMMAARHFSFPVVTGIKPTDRLSVRGTRMQLYQKFIAAIDSSGEHLSANLSEVNLSDPEDIRVTLPAKSSDLLLHFGDTNFLARYRIYQSHLAEWEQQYPQLASVDLRYDSEVVLKMAGQGSDLSDQHSGKQQVGDSPGQREQRSVIGDQHSAKQASRATSQGSASRTASTKAPGKAKVVPKKNEHVTQKHVRRKKR